jgi:hypothetical protein
MKKHLVYHESTNSIRQYPENYLVAHWQGNYAGWLCDPDMAADTELCVSVFRTIHHSWANKHTASGNEIVDMAIELHKRMH